MAIVIGTLLLGSAVAALLPLAVQSVVLGAHLRSRDTPTGPLPPSPS